MYRKFRDPLAGIPSGIHASSRLAVRRRCAFAGMNLCGDELVRAARGELIGLDEDDAEKLIADLKAIESEVAKFDPDPGAVVEFQYLTPRGYEAYSYNYGGGDKSRDGSKKLTILDHVGGDPLIVFAARKKGGLEQYQLLAKALEMLSPHLDVVLEKHLPAPYDENYSQFKQEFSPLLQKCHSITQTQLLPVSFSETIVEDLK